MTKRMRELQALIVAKTAEAKGFMEDGENKNLTKAAGLMDEVDKHQAEFDLLARIEKAGKDEASEGAEKQAEENKSGDSIKALADAARSCFKNLNETTGADGGYTVPEDIQTQINTYREERFSLRSLIDYESVNTKSGRRTYKARAQHTGFTQVAEGGKAVKTAKPQFSVINYDVKKYAGYLPVTNELLEDSDAAIAQTIIAWLGEEGIATENAQILAKINTVSATAMTKLDDIKKAINVTLAAFAGSVNIVTNSDGLQYLDTLKDGNGRYLLSPDPVNPMAMHLSVGARRIPVVVVPNEILATSGEKLPFIIGDLREFMKEFDRKQLTLAQSDVATIGDFNAFEQDMTLFRAIMRADFVVKDSKAIVRGELTPAAEATA